MRRHLILFVRVPRLGTGKRRLARDIGDIAALRFERSMLALLLRRLRADRRWHLQLSLTQEKARPAYGRHKGIETVDQGRGELGIRMRRALCGCRRGPVVLVGADIPALGARHVAAAFRLLGGHDLVFGPAADGGFWLVGARSPQRLPRLFERVRWSGPYALADTLAGLPRGMTVGFVERLEDVDDGDAYRRLAPNRGF
jgi:rSAM/selenodomain-associated transferase 1